MSGGAISPRAAAPVAAFHHSVRPGDWAAFADRFAPGATTRFAGGPAGPFNGREAIAAGYGVLVSLGVPGSRITVVGDGAHYPGRVPDMGPNGQLMLAQAEQDREVIVQLPKCQ